MVSTRNLLRTSLALLGVAAALIAPAQNQTYPTFKGDNNRTSQSIGSGPGRGNLRWYQPVGAANRPTTVIRNNTSSAANAVGAWNASTPANQASITFDPPSVLPAQDLIGALVGASTVNNGVVVTDRSNPAYFYSSTVVPSAIGGDPTVPSFGTASTFTWNIVPPTVPPFTVNEANTARNYALYVWLPDGPTGDTLFPLRFQVFEVIYGNGQRWVEVIDRDIAGNGWVRLGGNSGNSSRTFAYSGDPNFPIQVRLYNTIPRDAQNNLRETPASKTVYADAVQAVPEGPGTSRYVATPVVQTFGTGVTAQTRVVAALNRLEPSAFDPDNTTGSYVGEVSSYTFNTGVRNWTFRFDGIRAVAQVVDNDTGGVASAGWTPQPPAGTDPDSAFQGTNYLIAPVQQASIATAETVRYAAALSNGTWGIQVFVPGNDPANQYATAVRYQIFQGGTEVANVPVDLTNAANGGQSGWITIGNFAHDASTAPLTVVATNFSSAPADAGRRAYADAVRFTRQVLPAVNSTPVMVEARVRLNASEVIPPLRRVVIVAAEDGRLYCLDATGNVGGTTNLLWTYPSLPDPANPTDPDPNAVQSGGTTFDGVNGTITAEMPTGFNTSSALVQTVGGQDLLFIGSSNGRVYCIEMASRGDRDPANGRPNTAVRRWTFPSDFPAVRRPNLGPIRGSVVYGEPAGNPTLFVPDSQGRIYALDASANNPTRTTTVRWAFPQTGQPTLGVINATPAYSPTLNRLFFGTNIRGTNVDIPLALRPLYGSPDRGQFFGLDVSSTPSITNAGDYWRYEGDATNDPTDNFEGGPAFATAATLGGGMPDTVFASNQNGAIYAFNAVTGAGLWRTRELGNTVNAPLTLTNMTVIDNSGVGTVNTPVVLVPGSDGQYSALFARTAEINSLGVDPATGDGFRLAWLYSAAGGEQVAGISVGRNWMYSGDGIGNLYAWNDGLGTLPGFDNPPGSPGVPPNDPNAQQFRDAKMKLLTETGFRLLAERPTTLTRDAAVNTAAYSFDRTPLAFDWGERVYILVYDFPYDVDTPNGNAVTPPLIDAVITADGQNGRRQTVEARLFAGATVGAPNSGYAILDFPIQGSGQNALPPGRGRITISIRTASLANDGVLRTVPTIPTNTSREFEVANPIGIAMVRNATTASDGALGLSADPTLDENRVNGSPDVASTSRREDLLATSLAPSLNASFAPLNHGGTGVSSFYVYDRSLMTLLRGPNNGLNNIRVSRIGLGWTGEVFRPLNQAAFPNFEDLPTNFPNTSLDYPDIAAERLRVTKDPQGVPENPLSFGVALTPPLIPVTGSPAAPNPAARTVRATEFQLEVDVPRFQPGPVQPGFSESFTPNVPAFTDSLSRILPNGYQGQLRVFVDSEPNGVLNTNAGRREAFRAFTLAVGVAPDARLSVGTPTVDLGSLASTATHTPIPPGFSGSPFSPWNTTWEGMFRPFTVRNEGNVNLRNVRIAKGINVNGAFSPWPIFSDTVDDLAYLNGGRFILSDLDRLSESSTTSPSGSDRFQLTNNSIIQKARVGDRNATTLSTNPIRRANANLGTTGTTGTGLVDALLPANVVPPAPPRVGIGLPFGFPTGSFSQVLRVIEDIDDDEMLTYENSTPLEPFSDPTMTIRFRSRETRLTTTTTKQPRTSTGPITPSNPLRPMTPPMLDDLQPYTSAPQPFGWTNVQPTAFRSPTGPLVLAFASDRVFFNPGERTAPSDADRTRIFIGFVPHANIGGGGIVGSPSYSPTFVPLTDLQGFSPGTPTSMFRPLNLAGIPGDPSVWGGTGILDGTSKYGQPSFPSQVLGSNTTQPYLAFVGSVQRQVATGRISENRIFITTVDANAGSLIGGIQALATDPQVAKGKPSLVQAGTNAILFYSQSSAAGSEILWTTFDGAAFGTPAKLAFPSGFESVSSPSVQFRQSYANRGSLTVDALEMSFTGQLRGRASSEIYFARLRLQTGLLAPAGLDFLPIRTRERVTAEREVGLYRAEGLGWNPAAFVDALGRNVTAALLEQWIDADRDGIVDPAEIVDLEVPNTRTIDRTTGVISFDTRLGGRAFLDPEMGTVRFTTGVPIRSATLLLTTQPSVVRLSGASSAAYGSSTLLWDNRLTSLSVNPNNLQSNNHGAQEYWFLSDNVGAEPSDPISNDRYIAFYSRSATSGGQTARPFMRTFRFGLDLAGPVWVNPNNGRPDIQVTGLPTGSFYQVDPANGKVFVTSNAANVNITVAYATTDANGRRVTNGGSLIVESGTTILIEERPEAPVPIEQAANEQQLTAFLDPFDGNTANRSSRRPGLIWLFWSSTRNGNPDLYFQTLAPRFAPSPTGR